MANNGPYFLKGESPPLFNIIHDSRHSILHLRHCCHHTAHHTLIGRVNFITLRYSAFPRHIGRVSSRIVLRGRSPTVHPPGKRCKAVQPFVVSQRNERSTVPQHGATNVKNAESFCSADNPFHLVLLRRIFKGLLLRKPLEIFIFLHQS